MKAKERLRKLTRCATKDAVREVLRKARVKGVRENSFSCPIAQYIRSGEGVQSVRVDPHRLSRSSRLSVRIEWDGEIVRELTKAMNSFAISFDKGEYPELDAFKKGTR